MITEGFPIVQIATEFLQLHYWLKASAEQLIQCTEDHTCPVKFGCSDAVPKDDKEITDCDECINFIPLTLPWQVTGECKLHLGALYDWYEFVGDHWDEEEHSDDD